MVAVFGTAYIFVTMFGTAYIFVTVFGTDYIFVTMFGTDYIFVTDCIKALMVEDHLCFSTSVFSHTLKQYLLVQGAYLRTD